MKFSTIIRFVLFVFICTASCKKDNDGNVPITGVDILIYVNNPSYINLNAVGGWVYITGGVRGIIVYRKSKSFIDELYIIFPTGCE